MGGRHPGHYFMDSDDFNDIVSRNKVELPTLGSNGDIDGGVVRFARSQ